MIGLFGLTPFRKWNDKSKDGRPGLLSWGSWRALRRQRWWPGGSDRESNFTFSFQVGRTKKTPEFWEPSLYPKSASITQSKEERVAKALERATLLQVVPLLWDRVQAAYSLFVNSLAAYGWVARCPAQGTAYTLFKTFRGWLGTPLKELATTFVEWSIGAKFDLQAIIL